MYVCTIQYMCVEETKFISEVKKQLLGVRVNRLNENLIINFKERTTAKKIKVT